MSISVQCPGCKKKMTAKAQLAGKRVKCPGCGYVILVPAAQPASQAKTIKPAPGKPPIPKKSDGITAPRPKTPPAAKKADGVAAALPASLERRIRWPWYAGGAAAAGCLVAGLVFLFVPGKDRSAIRDDRPVLPDSAAVVARPDSKIGESGVGKGKSEDKARQRGITKEKVLGEWEGKFANGMIKLTFYDDQRRRGEWWNGVIVLKVGDRVNVGAMGWKIDAEKNEIRFAVDHGVVKATKEGSLVFSGGKFRFGDSEYTVPETRLERVKPEPPGAPQPKTSLPGAKGGITKEKLLGEWEGTLKDGTTVALMFTDKLVVVSILPRGIDRKKTRRAVEWASGDVLRRVVRGSATALSSEAVDWAIKNISPTLGDGIAIGSTEYKIDDKKNEVKIWGNQGWDQEWGGVAKPTKDGALVVSGDLRIATVPETRIERVKSEPPAAAKPKTSLPGAKEEGEKPSPAKNNKESEAATDEIWPKKARAQFFEKPADLWAVFLTASDKLPKGGC